MDGSGIPDATAGQVGALGGHDTLLRVVHYGEALRAIAEHVSDSLTSGPPETMLDLLADAYGHLSRVRPEFSPEEFALYVMSLMLGLCDDAEEARRFRIGAAAYIVRSAVRLPADYQGIVREAEEMLRISGHGDGDAIAAGARRLVSPEFRGTEDGDGRSLPPEGESSIGRGMNRPDGAAGRRRAHARPEGRGRPGDAQAARPTGVRRRPIGKKAGRGRLERVALVAFVAGWLVLVLAYAFGGLDLPPQDQTWSGPPGSGQL